MIQSDDTSASGAPAAAIRTISVASCILAVVSVASWPGFAVARPHDSLDPAVSALFQSLLMERVGFLVLGTAFLAIGLSVLLLAMVRTELRDMVMLLFAAMSLLWGLRFVCRAPAFVVAIGGAPETWALFTRFLAYASAPVAFGFVWRLFGPGWRSSMRLITWISIAFAITASVFLWVVPDPELLLHEFNFLMLIGIAIIAFNILRPDARGNSALNPLIVGGFGCLVFVVLENLRSLGVARIPFDMEWIGVVILYGALGHMTVIHFVGIEHKLAALRQELATARQIQTSNLPQASPSTRQLDIATRYVPMTEVAGDFFDFARIDADSVGVLIADVSGHGVPAALIASMVKVAFQAQTGHGAVPGRVLAGMNEMLGHRLQGQFVTASYACIDSSAATIRYAGAGHPPPYLRTRGGDIEDLLNNGFILGPFPEARYESTERPLEPGDRILMYTDGIVEAFNGRQEEFGAQRTKDLLSASAGLSASDFADRLLHEVKAWTGLGRDGAFDDDLTVIVIDVL